MAGSITCTGLSTAAGTCVGRIGAKGCDGTFKNSLSRLWFYPKPADTPSPLQLLSSHGDRGGHRSMLAVTSIWEVLRSDQTAISVPGSCQGNGKGSRSVSIWLKRGMRPGMGGSGPCSITVTARCRSHRALKRSYRNATKTPSVRSRHVLQLLRAALQGMKDVSKE